jgi:hypothetical protein
MPGVAMEVSCVACAWHATLSEGGRPEPNDPGLVVLVESLLCLHCRDVVSVETGHDDDGTLQERRCNRCGRTELSAWPGRDESLLLREAADRDRLGVCPRCGGRVEPSGLEILWD